MSAIGMIESLRRGEVPEEDFDKIQVNRKDILMAIESDLEYISNSTKAFKTRYLSGDFGSGKSFMLKMLEKMALKRNFAVSYVVLDEKNNRLDRLETTYRAIMENLRVGDVTRGAVSIAEIFVNWNKIDFKSDFKSAKLRMYELTPGTAYLSVCLHSFYTKPELRTQIISWLMREKTVLYSDKKAFNVKGDIDRTNCLNYLSSITRLIKQAGYAGTIIILDEVESVTRLRKDAKLAALENIRLLDDNVAASITNAGMYFAGTPEFFESEEGIKSYPALNSRLQIFPGMKKNYKQTILDLEPLNKQYREKLLANIKEVYEEAYKIKLSHVSEKVIAEADRKATDRKMTIREIVKIWIAYLDSVSS